MRSAVLLVAAGIVPSAALAVEEPFCAFPENCADDLLSIRFPVNGTSELTGVLFGDTFEAEVFLDVKSTPLQGFSLGVKHDPALLEIQSATHRGADPIISNARGDGGADFKVTQLAEDNEDKGFIQAVVITLDSEPPLEFPIRDGIKTAIARYRVRAAVPAVGTKIQFTNDLNPPGSPRTTTHVTLDGRARQPRKVNNAVVRMEISDCSLPDFAFYFGPQATTVEFDVAGASQVPITLRNRAIALGFSLGIKRNGGALAFDSTLGLPPVELIVTRVDGSEVSGDALKGNSARNATAGDIVDILKGPALAGPAGDFFGKRILAPGVDGGPGATVGYVSDASGNGRSIPATIDTAATCGGNQILQLLVGGEDGSFSRGDANGDGKINITDGVLLAQNIFARQFIVFDCKDMLDANDDGALNTADPVMLLSYVFFKGPQPAHPFKVCVFLGDPTPDNLGCAQPNCSE